MQAFLDGILARLGVALSPASMADGIAALIANMFVAGVVFLAFYLGWRIIERLMRPALARAQVDQTAARFAVTTTKVVVLTIGLINALAAIGINTGSVLASLGVAGLTIGFAARDGLSNIISGIFIFWDRPFVIGDLIEVEGHYGRVDDITLRSTRVVTVDGKMLSIPNTTMVSSTVASYTNFPHLRLDIAVGVAPGEDIDRVRRLLLELVRDDETFIKDPPPVVTVTELGTYDVTVGLHVWLANERAHVEERARLREAVFVKLRDAGVDMPNETISVTPLEIRRAAAG